MNTRLIVQKYGGSSLADVASLHHVADRVVERKKEGYDVVVVVSAMGDSTDELLALAQKVSPTPPRRELDMLLTAGERVTMSLLSMAIQDRGFDAISFTGSQSGILTNDRHVDASIIEVRPIRIQDELVRGKIVIVAGFQGMSYKREITTLGRGGSDTTAIALAAALEAESCEIYSDVDGVYSADPRVVPQATRIDEIDYDTMLEMSRFGARVLHAEAIEFARAKGIALVARATRGGAGQTLVRKDRPPHADAAPVLAVSCISPLSWLTADSEDAILALTDALFGEGIAPLLSCHLPNQLSLALHEEDQPEVKQWLQTRKGPWSVATVATVSLIGPGLVESPSILHALLQELSARPASTRPLAYLQTPRRCTWVVPEPQAVDFQQTLAKHIGTSESKA